MKICWGLSYQNYIYITIPGVLIYNNLFSYWKHLLACIHLSFFKVHLSFLHVGHTHEDIDASFSQLSMKLRKADAETMPQLLSLLNGANQLRGLFDIKAWLEPCLNNIKKHSKPLHFKFNKDVTQKTVMQDRANSNRPWNFTDEAILIQFHLDNHDYFYHQISIKLKYQQYEKTLKNNNTISLEMASTVGGYSIWTTYNL